VGDVAAELALDFEKRFAGGPTLEPRLSFSTEGSAVTALFGPSGSGKTTILRCLAGLERPERGTIRFGDEVWLDASRGLSLPPQARRVGFLSQDYALFPHLSVERNIAYGEGADSRRVAELVALLDLAGTESKRPAELSGGQKQRVALAHALASRPRLLLLDEPLSALDGPTRERLRGDLRQRLVHAGLPAIVVTHDRVEALALADRIAVLSEGTVRQVGAVDEVFSRPVDATVAGIVGVETVVEGRIVETVEGLVTVAVGDARLTAVDTGGLTPDVLVCIRAESVLLEREPTGAVSARNVLRGQIVSVVPEGPLVRVTLHCGFRLAALVTRPAAEELDLRAGDGVTAVVKAPSVHLVGRGA